MLSANIKRMPKITIGNEYQLNGEIRREISTSLKGELKGIPIILEEEI